MKTDLYHKQILLSDFYGPVGMAESILQVVLKSAEVAIKSCMQDKIRKINGWLSISIYMHS